MALAITIAHAVWQSIRVDLWVTSVNDGVHPGGAKPSYHPLGKAVDLRSKNIPTDTRAWVYSTLKEALGPEFTVLWESKGQENEHFHCQWEGTV